MRAEEPKGERMSSQCNRFVQNAWKKDLCSNCFKSREEHLEALENSKFHNGRSTVTSTKLPNGNAKPQSILKGKTSSRRKKNVGFPDALTEVIGYGGDDFSDSEEFELSDSFGIEDSSVDTEEERALCNLTRSNTNFNTITANLSGNNVADGKKSFASLMLGKPRKDSDGKKKPLLVSVTPFGRDEVVSSAKRPSEKKASSSSSSGGGFGANLSNFHTAFGSLSKGGAESVATEAKSEVTLKSVHQIPDDGKQLCREKIEKEPTTSVVDNGLEKIVDMPLITSSNLIAVIQKSDSLSLENSARTSNESYQKSSDADKKSTSDRKIGISRSAAVKKTKDTEKPKISAQGSYKQIVSHRQEVVALATTKPDEPSGEDEKSAKKWKDDAIFDHDSVTFSADVISRELAGEPDGKADEDTNCEPPALPRSPPPVDSRLKHVSVTLPSSEPRNSFLHNAEKKTKPAIPTKPTSLPPKTPAATKIGPTKSQNNASIRPDEEISGLRYKELPSSPRVLHDEPPTQDETRRIDGQTPRDDVEASPEEDDDDGESFSHLQTEGDPDAARSGNKRRMAPKPPPPSSYAATDETSASIFARNPGLANAKSDAPVVREKEKRERASSCSPKFRKDALDSENTESAVAIAASSGTDVAAPPRRGISLSQDSLANADKIEEHKKKGRSRFSLKKFLRMGSKKDQVDGVPRSAARNDDVLASPPPTSSAKPRLEIIHPLELDGAAVEVVSRDTVSRLTDETKTAESSDADKSQHPASPSSPTANSTFHHAFARPGKPPPPPRNQSLDDWARLDPANKPARPPPPRAEIKASPKSWQPPPSPATQSDSIYANLAAEDVPGEIRSGLAPSKPQRTASMRDQAISQPPVKKRPTTISSRHRDYEALDISRSPIADSPMSNDGHSYECLSSSPECDSSLDLRRGNLNREFQSNGKRKSDSSILDPTNDFKYNQSFARSTSLPYCGSETESELYAPHSFYTGDEGPEEDQDWKSNREQDSGVGRLRRRRGRSIVHRSLEDNYGAVVVSNHEALAQVLEQLNQTTTIPPALRGLKTRELHLADFSVDRNTCVTIGRRAFYSASWNDNSVTICISQDNSPRVAKKEFSLVPIVEFTDSVPAVLAEQMRTQRREKEVEATISVLPHLQICTVESFVKSFKDTNEESFAREASFVLLQLVNALRSLQTRGIETVSRDLVQAVLCREDKDSCFRLYLLQRLPTDDLSSEKNDKITLCRWVAGALKELLLAERLTVIPELLSRERAVTLSQVKSVLEFSLWGPADVTLGVPREREVTLQRWLDLERATVLHALVKERAPLTVTDEYHLLFLVRTSAQIMCEASMLLESQRKKLKD